MDTSRACASDRSGNIPRRQSSSRTHISRRGKGVRDRSCLHRICGLCGIKLQNSGRVELRGTRPHADKTPCDEDYGSDRSLGPLSKRHGRSRVPALLFRAVSKSFQLDLSRPRRVQYRPRASRKAYGLGSGQTVFPKGHGSLLQSERPAGCGFLGSGRGKLSAQGIRIVGRDRKPAMRPIFSGAAHRACDPDEGFGNQAAIGRLTAMCSR